MVGTTGESREVDLLNTSGANPLLKLDGISKEFGGIQALNSVILELHKGSVHAFVGENGAGKSTLGKIISGVIRPDGGTLLVNGSPTVFNSPRDALHQGICLISQEISLVPQLTVRDNIFLGLESGRFNVINESSQQSKMDDLLSSVGFDVNPDSVVSSLGTSQKQLVEILRAIARDARLIVMDEPTAAVSDVQAKELHRVIRELSKSGTAIVYISHSLSDVISISDEVTILRNGQKVRTSNTSSETQESLIDGMLGRNLGTVFPLRKSISSAAEVVLSAKAISTNEGLNKFSISVRKGEIVGLAGLMGSGRSEALRALFGADVVISGELQIHDEDVTFRTPNDAVSAGIAMVPESRKEQGLILGMIPHFNVTLPHLKDVSLRGCIRHKIESKNSEQLLTALDVRGDRSAPIGAMSGGNQQKALFGKWLFGKPFVFLIDEPTKGVDVGAKLEIYRLIHKMSCDGVAIVLVSSDIEEILGITHVVHVMRHGSIVASFETSRISENEVMRAAFGLSDEVAS
jgi:ABC-type sugar transport system ATPase subunit